MPEHVYEYKPDFKSYAGRLIVMTLIWGGLASLLYQLPDFVEHYNKGRYLTGVLPYFYKAVWVLYAVYFLFPFVPIMTDLYLQRLIVNGNQYIYTSGLLNRSQKVMWEQDIISTEVIQTLWQKITNTGTIYLLGRGYAYIEFRGISNPKRFIHRHLPDFEYPEYSEEQE